MKYLLIILCFLISCSSSDDVIVRYVVSGTATNANIEYSIEEQVTTLDSVNLPWEYEYKLWSDEDETFIITLTAEKITGDNSTIDLTILIDGAIYTSDSFNGPYERETIQAKIRLDGSDFD